MLELKQVTKDYKAGDTIVHALNGVDISFRKSEFVSILGPSGCGKTTLLNIIGGLDHYTSGEMYIDGVSTKSYGDRDWDTYRNHRIGFVFQSYNLIPHQTISENVELALNISGVERAERIRRAHEALDKVGLKDQYNKKPNQLSGGQCQRVAIARALVNDPEILLADEPTGALDTVTSVQIMDLIREIANKCLVVMVTHNPDLAEKYSTRIIKLIDGNVVSDSNPFDASEEAEAEETPQTAQEVNTEAAATAESDETEQTVFEGVEDNGKSGKGKHKAEKKKSKKSKLSIWSAFRLSAKNLMSKFKRTLLVCFAGSIGIIGVATVLAVSTGVKDYITDMQNDMLSGNPVTVSTDAFDFSSIMESMSSVDKAKVVSQSVEKGYVNVEHMIDFLAARGGDMSSAMIHNDITNDYLEFVKAMPKSYYSEITATYGLNLSNNLYTDFELEGYDEPRNMSLSAAIAMYTSLLKQTEFKDYASYIPMVTDSFGLAPDNAEFILSQYEYLSDPDKSKIPSEADEIMIVVSDKAAIADLILAQYGYFSQEEFLNLAYKAVNDEDYDESLLREKFPIDDILGKEFTWYPNDTVFTPNDNSIVNPADGTLLNPFTYSAYSDSFSDAAKATGKKLKITAILKPKSTTSYGCLSTGFYYTSALAKEIIASGMESDIAAYMNAHDTESLISANIGGMNMGVTYDYSYRHKGEEHNEVGYVGSVDQMSAMLGAMLGQTTTSYTLTLREIGGLNTPSRIVIFPKNFDLKDDVCAYLNKWNSDEDIVLGDKTLKASDREDISYTDNLALVISMINDLIDIVTTALVAFTALSLVVSTVMVAIITYVSVMERIKEIGVIRSLGGRKRDVSALFNAETFIIGGVSGVIGVTVTYIISAILNAVIGSAFGIATIAKLTIPTALIMIAISIGLTLISGLIPARLAAKKDPVVALRTE